MTPAEAARIILEHCQPLAKERRPLRDALDAVLAEDVTSPIDLPPWDNSAMDGYAVRSADLSASETTLAVIETIAAGQFPQKAIGPAQATRIFTGAAAQGADTVIAPGRHRAGTGMEGEGGRGRRRSAHPGCEEEHSAPWEDIQEGRRGAAVGECAWSGPARRPRIDRLRRTAGASHAASRIHGIGR
jgi:hypothetical protein